MKSINSKYLSLLLTSLVPSSLMGLSSYFITLKDSHASILKSLTSGLLLYSGFNILNDTTNKKLTILSFIVSILFLNFKNKSNDSILSSLYFDCVSDGLLLGAIFNNIKNVKEMLVILVSLSLEMSITGISVVDQLRVDKKKNYKRDVVLGSVIFGLSILFGYFISNFVNKNVVYGIGSASMIWLSIVGFITKSVIPSNFIYIFVGIIVAMYL